MWELFSRWKEIDQFWVGLFGYQNSVLDQSSHGPSVSQNKCPVKVFLSKQFMFLTKESNRISNLDPFCPLERN